MIYLHIIIVMIRYYLLRQHCTYGTARKKDSELQPQRYVSARWCETCSLAHRVEGSGLPCRGFQSDFWQITLASFLIYPSRDETHPTKASKSTETASIGLWQTGLWECICQLMPLLYSMNSRVKTAQGCRTVFTAAPTGQAAWWANSDRGSLFIH